MSGLDVLLVLDISGRRGLLQMVRLRNVAGSDRGRSGAEWQKMARNGIVSRFYIIPCN